VTRPFAQPALQVLGAAGALFAFTWPFLVFDRPVHVFVSFFLIWLAVIVMLLLFSRAHEQRAADELELEHGGDDDA
jgi:hypothetical protein